MSLQTIPPFSKKEWLYAVLHSYGINSNMHSQDEKSHKSEKYLRETLCRLQIKYNIPIRISQRALFTAATAPPVRYSDMQLLVSVIWQDRHEVLSNKGLHCPVAVPVGGQGSNPRHEADDVTSHDCNYTNPAKILVLITRHDKCNELVVTRCVK